MGAIRQWSQPKGNFQTSLNSFSISFEFWHFSADRSCLTSFTIDPTWFGTFGFETFGFNQSKIFFFYARIDDINTCWHVFQHAIVWWHLWHVFWTFIRFSKFEIWQLDGKIIIFCCCVFSAVEWRRNDNENN